MLIQWQSSHLASFCPFVLPANEVGIKRWNLHIFIAQLQRSFFTTFLLYSCRLQWLARLALRRQCNLQECLRIQLRLRDLGTLVRKRKRPSSLQTSKIYFFLSSDRNVKTVAVPFSGELRAGCSGTMSHLHPSFRHCDQSMGSMWGNVLDEGHTSRSQSGMRNIRGCVFLP